MHLLLQPRVSRTSFGARTVSVSRTHPSVTTRTTVRTGATSWNAVSIGIV